MKPDDKGYPKTGEYQELKDVDTEDLVNIVVKVFKSFSQLAHECNFNRTKVDLFTDRIEKVEKYFFRIVVGEKLISFPDIIMC